MKIYVDQKKLFTHHSILSLEATIAIPDITWPESLSRQVATRMRNTIFGPAAP